MIHLVGCCGLHAADAIAKQLKLPVSKAIDPLDPDGFLRIVSRLAGALRGVTEEEEAKALRAALRALDVDWKNLSADQRESVFQAAKRAMAPLPARVLPSIDQQFQVVGSRVVGDTRKESIRRFGLKLNVSLSQRDVEAEKFIRANAGNFITDAYGTKLDELGVMAREVVARGLESGFGSEEITGQLEKQLGDRVMRSRSYWNTVAMSFTNQSRTFSQLNAYSEAGIQQYAFEAVLDEVTTDQCRFYHGKVFSVGAAVARATKLMQAKSPEEVKSLNPWVRVGSDDEGKRILFIEREGQKVQLATVERSGYGSRDDVGDYSDAASPKKLEEEGIPWPPLHGKCRSTIVPSGLG